MPIPRTYVTPAENYGSQKALVPGGRTSKGAESKRSLAYSLVRSGKACGAELGRKPPSDWLHVQGRSPARGWPWQRAILAVAGWRSNFPGLERGACRESAGRLSPAGWRPRVGSDMQSTDLGNKESGKIWHRKPSPAARDG